MYCHYTKVVCHSYLVFLARYLWEESRECGNREEYEMNKFKATKIWWKI